MDMSELTYSLPAKGAVVIGGIFWITHWPPHHAVLVPNRKLYRSNIVWDSHKLIENGIVVAMPLDSNVTIEEGKGYKMSGVLRCDDQRLISILDVDINTIVEVDSANLKAENLTERIKTIGSGPVAEFQNEPCYDEEHCKIDYRIVELRAEAATPRVIYRVPEEVYKKSINKCKDKKDVVTMKGIMSGYDDFLWGWIVEVVEAQFGYGDVE